MLNLLNELIQTFPETLQFAKKIQLILVHLRIYYLNSSIDVGYSEAVWEMLQLIVGQYEDKRKLGMHGETIVALLYNVLKILLGIDEIPEKIMNVLSLILRQYNMPTPVNYNETIFRLFIIIKIVIFKQS